MDALTNENQSVNVTVNSGAFSVTDTTDSYATGEALPTGDNNISAGLGFLDLEQALTNLGDAFVSSDGDDFPDEILGGGLDIEPFESFPEGDSAPFLDSSRNSSSIDVYIDYTLGVGGELNNIPDLQNEISTVQNSLDTFVEDMMSIFNFSLF